MKQEKLEDRLVQSPELLKMHMKDNPEQYINDRGEFVPPESVTSVLSDLENFYLFDAAMASYKPEPQITYNFSNDN